MNLKEHVSYLEERALSERFPEVRVIRLNPQQGIGHLFVSEYEEGIETARSIIFANGCHHTVSISMG